MFFHLVCHSVFHRVGSPSCSLNLFTDFSLICLIHLFTYWFTWIFTGGCRLGFPRDFHLCFRSVQPVRPVPTHANPSPPGPEPAKAGPSRPEPAREAGRLLGDSRSLWGRRSLWVPVEPVRSVGISRGAFVEPWPPWGALNHGMGRIRGFNGIRRLRAEF